MKRATLIDNCERCGDEYKVVGRFCRVCDNCKPKFFAEREAKTKATLKVSGKKRGKRKVIHI